jgi:predicted Zn finger-like uncharacterized protein
VNVSCPECRSVFRVDPTKIPTAGVRARCSVCGGVITVGKGGAIENDFSDGRAAVSPAARPAPRPQPPRAPTPAAPTPAAPTPGVAPFARNTPLTGSRPVAPPIPTPASTRPSAPVMQPPPPRTSAPNVPGAARSTAQPPAAPRHQPAQATPVSSSAPTPRASAPAPAAPAAAAPATPSRSINPFLSNDPNLKAKRLARALVSDIVAYFPQKREEGLRNGTLKQLFREEIKKSYEEYVDQMGKELAETTTHFQDALNEVLAGGKKLF